MPGIRKLRPGDVVVFNSPDGRDVNTINFKINYVYAKRCIGCPGDTIRIIGGFYHNSDFGGIIGQQYMQEKLSETPDSTLWMMGVSVDAGQFAGNNGWTVKNFGPLYVPEKGISIRLDPETALKFAKIIQYETGFWPEIQNNKVFINGIYRNEYCFQENYYFLGGDNVFNSRDSRYIGLIPEEYVIGVATTILFSKDSNGDFRHDRWFKAIFG